MRDVSGGCGRKCRRWDVGRYVRSSRKEIFHLIVPEVRVIVTRGKRQVGSDKRPSGERRKRRSRIRRRKNEEESDASLVVFPLLTKKRFRRAASPPCHRFFLRD